MRSKENRVSGGRIAVLAATVVASAASIAVAFPAQADPPPPPPYVDHTEWVHIGGLSSLRVYPTPAGRLASTDFVKPDEAWSEVLADAPDAGQPGMRDQFVCHWELAEFAEPGKTSWNLEPWRPVVPMTAMLQAGCNPDSTGAGGAGNHF